MGPLARLVVLAGVVASTNRYLDPAVDVAEIRRLGGGDAFSYLQIAEAAPSLPALEPDRLEFHHAQRFAIPYAIGLIGRAGVPLHVAFVVVSALIMMGIVLVAGSTLATLQVARPVATVAVAMIAFDPWVMRAHLMVPEMIDDTTFVLGMLVAIHGLVRRSPGIVLLGLLAASLSRQTGLLLVPVVVLWVALDWGRPAAVAPWTRVLTVAGASLVTIGTYLGTAAVAYRFAATNENAVHVLGLADWLRESFNGITFVAFLARACIALAIPAACIVAVLAGGRAIRDRLIPLLLALVAVACWTQPVLAGPLVTEGNAPRLTALGAPALVLAWATVAPVASESRRWRYLAAVALLFVTSLHPKFVLSALAFEGSRWVAAVAYAALTVLIATLLTPPHGSGPSGQNRLGRG